MKVHEGYPMAHISVEGIHRADPSILYQDTQVKFK